MQLKDFKDRYFYKTMLSIAIPITIQNLISSSLNMVDTVMIGRVGEAEIAAVGLANQMFFLFMLIVFGTNSGATIFIAQFWGKRDVGNIRRVLGISIITGGIVSALFGLGAFFIPEQILKIFSKDQQVIQLGTEYLKIIALSYPLTALSFSYSFACRSVGQARLPMVISAVSLITNTGLNYIFIFGNFGFPAMGVAGAALATLIARAIELLLTLKMIYGYENVLAGKIHEMTDLTLTFVSRFFSTTYPVILNEAFWALGMVMYSVAYARIGTEAIAAVQISNTIHNLFMVMTMGLANACAVMLGNQIGAHNNHKAISYAYIYSVLGPAVGIILGIGLFLSAPLILSLFHISSKVYEDAYRIIAVYAFFEPIKIYTAILIVGILRSGGDTKFSLFLEIGSVWIVGVPLAFLGAFVWKFPVYWVVALVSLEELVKAIIGIPRMVSKKWVRNVVDHM